MVPKIETRTLRQKIAKDFAKRVPGHQEISHKINGQQLAENGRRDKVPGNSLRIKTEHNTARKLHQHQKQRNIQPSCRHT